MSFFEGLAQTLVIGELGFNTIVFAKDRLGRFLALPKIRAIGLFKQFRSSCLELRDVKDASRDCRNESGSRSIIHVSR